MSTPRDELFHGRENYSRPGAASNYGATDRAALEAQRAAMRVEDAQLEELSTSVSGIRNVAGILSAEVDGQNKLLDRLDRDVEAANERTQAATARADGLEKSPYSWENLCKLLWPLVFLIVLSVTGLKHFLFY